MPKVYPLPPSTAKANPTGAFPTLPGDTAGDDRHGRRKLKAPPRSMNVTGALQIGTAGKLAEPPARHQARRQSARPAS